jgi:excisionase family DNA binding protein
MPARSADPACSSLDTVALPLIPIRRRQRNVPEPLLSVDEAADALRVSPKTVRRLIARGELPALRVGRQLRIGRDGFFAYLRRQLLAP